MSPRDPRSLHSLTPASDPKEFTTTSRLDRYFVLLAGILLAILAASQIGSASQESQTNDEPVHLTAGYVYLTTGTYGMELSHPPLVRLLAALPLLTLPLKRIPPGQAWTTFQSLIWNNPVPPSTILMHARLAIIALTILFGAWLGCWTRRQFGAPVALLALTFFAFDPNIVAHGHYVTTDLIASFGIFLTCTLWTDFLQKPGVKTLLLAIAALGLALASKYSALFLLLVLPSLYAIAWWSKRGQPFFTVRGSLGVLLSTTLGAALCIALVYAPDIATRPRSSWAGGLNSLPYIQGMNEQRIHNLDGHTAYLLGHFRSSGWWEYFPVAALVKTLTGVLLGCLIAAACLFYFRRQTAPILPLVCLALPPAVYFLLAMRSSINIGVRHILPVYPFLYVLLSFMLVRYGRDLLGRASTYTIAALVVLTCAESLSTYPHYLAFFNWPSGGPANGARYLLDSNLDWGQDTANLKRYAEQAGAAPLCTALFGYTPIGYFAPGSRNLLTSGMPGGVENVNCVVAVSVNFLRGLYMPAVMFAPLRQRQPFATIGHSVYLYDLRH